MSIRLTYFSAETNISIVLRKALGLITLCVLVTAVFSVTSYAYWGGGDNRESGMTLSLGNYYVITNPTAEGEVVRSMYIDLTPGGEYDTTIVLTFPTIPHNMNLALYFEAHSSVNYSFYLTVQRIEYHKNGKPKTEEIIRPRSPAITVNDVNNLEYPFSMNGGTGKIEYVITIEAIVPMNFVLSAKLRA